MAPPPPEPVADPNEDGSACRRRRRQDVEQIQSVWIKNFEGVVQDHTIVEYRVKACGFL